MGVHGLLLLLDDVRTLRPIGGLRGVVGKVHLARGATGDAATGQDAEKSKHEGEVLLHGGYPFGEVCHILLALAKQR